MIRTAATAEEIAQMESAGSNAVAQLFDQYRPRLVRMVLLRLDERVLGKVDVEDILQDAYVETARRIQDFLARPTVPFFIWLRQITNQVLIDVHRRYLGAQMRDVRRERSLDRWKTSCASGSHLVAQLAANWTSPSQFAVRNEMTEALHGALRDLDDMDREVLVLRHLEELDNNEVAATLGIGKYAASKRYLRALAKLRNNISATTYPH